MILYKRFLLLVLLSVCLSYIISVIFVESFWFKFLTFLLVFTISYTLFIVMPYKLQHRFIRFKKYVTWIGKAGTIFDSKVK